MINILPSKGVKKATGIDFVILGRVLETIIQPNHRKPVAMTVHMYKSRQAGVSYVETYERDLFTIFLDQTSRQTRKFIFGSILHEIRHCCQLNLWNYWPCTYKFKTYEEYFNSKEERDARKAEKLTRQLIKMYDLHVKVKKQYSQFGLTRLG
jgi:hypothetical protein